MLNMRCISYHRYARREVSMNSIIYMKPISLQSKVSVVCSVSAAVFIDFCLKKLNVFPNILVEDRAGVLVLGTRTRSTRVLNFWYSYCTRTRGFQSNSTRTCTRTQVLRYSYEYWHEYWYSMAHLWCKGENHHTCETNSLTCREGKVTNWFILLWFRLNIRYFSHLT